MDDRLKRFTERVDKGAGEGLIWTPDQLAERGTPRLRSDILSLDIATGGGYPFGAFTLLLAGTSNGKTTLCMHAMAQVPNFDHITKKHKDFVNPEDFVPGASLVVDFEGTFDEKWAATNGVQPDSYLVAKPTNAENGCDIVADALNGNEFDLIVIDSIEAMIPEKFMADSAETHQMGKKAIMTNTQLGRFERFIGGKWKKKEIGPAIIMINQWREKIGILMGDNRVVPGGKKQEFLPSLRVELMKIRREDLADTPLGQLGIKGKIAKNKTYRPYQEFECKVGQMDSSKLKAGQVNNIDMLVKFGLQHDLILRGGGKVEFNGVVYPTQKALKEELDTCPEVCSALWREIVRTTTGNVV